MTTSYPYVVFGVTGRTGAATAEALLRSGQPVRAVVRDPVKGQAWTERGADVVVADLTDLAAMTQALSQVRGAYVVSPQHYNREDLFERAALIADITARAVTAAAVPKLVALSSVGADRESGTGWIKMNRMLEQSLAKSGVPTIFLRAAYFMENWTPMIGAAVRSGTLPSFLSPLERPIPMIATVDVGQAAAALLQENWSGNRAVTLSGPTEYSPSDVAAIIEITRGQAVGAVALPEAEWPDALADANFSKAALAGFTEMTRSLNNAHIDRKSDPDATEWFGTTSLQHVIAALARCES